MWFTVSMAWCSSLVLTTFANFAAACMTWDLAESGEQFVTTIINGSDLVPTFSTSSIDDLRSEVQYPFLLVTDTFCLAKFHLLMIIVQIWNLLLEFSKSFLSSGHSFFLVKWYAWPNWANKSPKRCLPICNCFRVSSAKGCCCWCAFAACLQQYSGNIFLTSLGYSPLNGRDD